MLDADATASTPVTSPSSTELRDASDGKRQNDGTPQGTGVEQFVSPFPAWCDLRILHIAVPEYLSTVTVRYVVSIEEGGESWMGAAEVWVCEVGSDESYDFSTHFERTTQGHALPESLHGIIEDAAEAAWTAHREGERALDAHNRELSSAYLHWKEFDQVDGVESAMTATRAGCR